MVVQQDIHTLRRKKADYEGQKKRSQDGERKKEGDKDAVPKPYNNNNRDGCQTRQTHKLFLFFFLQGARAIQILSRESETLFDQELVTVATSVFTSWSGIATAFASGITPASPKSLTVSSNVFFEISCVFFG